MIVDGTITRDKLLCSWLPRCASMLIPRILVKGGQLRPRVSPLSRCPWSIINTSYQKLPFGSGDYPDKLLVVRGPDRSTAKNCPIVMQSFWTYRTKHVFYSWGMLTGGHWRWWLTRSGPVSRQEDWWNQRARFYCLSCSRGTLYTPVGW